jgi:hypothetical protein
MMYVSTKCDGMRWWRTAAFIKSGNEYAALFLGSDLIHIDKCKSVSIWHFKCMTTHTYVVSWDGMKAFFWNQENFIASLFEHPHDLLQNSAWTHTYAHVDTHALMQSEELGTDNHWLEIYYQNTSKDSSSMQMEPCG